MRRFWCARCQRPVFFDSVACGHCALALGYSSAHDEVLALDGPGCFGRYTVESCNWMPRPGEPWCAACSLDLAHDPSPNRAAFQNAKRRTLRQLLRFGVDPDLRDPQLRFDLRHGTVDAPVSIGHADGCITLDTSEAEPAHREEVRARLGEAYRTPLGHVRHELGHWYWQSAHDRSFDVEAFRALFGDERGEYAEALEAHYERVDDGSWRTQYVSRYAGSHPWEDFAESFAHYLSMADTAETASAWGLGDHGDGSFEALRQHWAELAVALNELNRSMGTPDPYPFAPSPAAIRKISFVATALAGETRAEL